jgi:hypothetical protein
MLLLYLYPYPKAFLIATHLIPLLKNKLYGKQVYVPKIVQLILVDPSNSLNLKGFAVGDACAPPDICDSKAAGQYFTIEFSYGKNAFQILYIYTMVLDLLMNLQNMI